MSENQDTVAQEERVEEREEEKDQEDVPPPLTESANIDEEQDKTTNGEEKEVKVEISATDDAQKTVEEGSLINAAEDDDAKLFVGGLSWDTETFNLRDYFSKFGEVKDCTIKKDSKTERSRGFGFVLFAEASSLQKVLNTPTHFLDGRKIDPKRAQAQRKKVFVGGINTETDNEKVKEHFAKFGEIDNFERPIDKVTQKKKRFCFITFKKDASFKECVAQKTQDIDGSTVEVKEAQEQNRGGFMGRGGPMGRGGWGGPGGFSGPGGYGYGGGGGYGYNMGYGGAMPYGGYGGGYGTGGFGNYGGYGGGAYGGGAAGGFGKAPRRGAGGHASSFKPY